MYTKEELESMDIPQLMGIASELGLKVKQDDDLESVVYAILDKAAEEGASPKRKRTRILKKDTSRVYSVNGEEGENYDTAKNRKKKISDTPTQFEDIPKTEQEADEQPAAEEAPAEEAAPAPKKRSRKTKAEKEAEAAVNAEAEEQAAEATEAPEAEAAAVAEDDSFIPEASFDVPEAEFTKGSGNEIDEEEQKSLLQQLQAKMAQRGRE
jgi:transcription termination factor Rho